MGGGGGAHEECGVLARKGGSLHKAQQVYGGGGLVGMHEVPGVGGGGTHEARVGLTTVSCFVLCFPRVKKKMHCRQEFCEYI